MYRSALNSRPDNEGRFSDWSQEANCASLVRLRDTSQISGPSEVCDLRRSPLDYSGSVHANLFDIGNAALALRLGSVTANAEPMS